MGGLTCIEGRGVQASTGRGLSHREWMQRMDGLALHELSKNSVFTVGRKICILQLMELGNIGIPMPSTECMGLYRGGLLFNRSELDAMGGMPLGV